MIYCYFVDYVKYYPNEWKWESGSRVFSDINSDQNDWNELYRNTRARPCGSHGENRDILPDFYSIEKDADRFGLRDVSWTDIFGLTWHGEKGCFHYAGAPDYEGHLYYRTYGNEYENDEEDDVLISEKYTENNPPDPNIYVRTGMGNNAHYFNIADVIDVDYKWLLTNHLFKDAEIELKYENEIVISVNRHNGDFIDIVKAFQKFGKQEFLQKLLKKINQHFEELKNSENENIRGFYPGKTAEKYFGIESLV